MYIKLYLDKMLEQNSKVTYEQHVKVTLCVQVLYHLYVPQLNFAHW
jgi:hypothetical protein